MVTYRELSTRITRNTNDGRGAKAIALQCRADGVDITPEEAQGIMDTYFDQYPRVADWLAARKDDVIKKGYVETLWHRYRRFKPLQGDTKPNEAILAAEQREACNAPIQGTVADSVNVAIYNLLQYRFLHPICKFKIAMQIHDSLILQVHKDDASFVYNKLFPYAMVSNNPIFAEGPSGDMCEYHFGADREVSIWWGEPLTDTTCMTELGLTKEELLGEKEDYSKYYR